MKMDTKDEIIKQKHDQIDSLIDEVWDLYDHDQNGLLDRKEAKNLFSDIFNAMGDNLNKTQQDFMFRQIDTDADGTLSKWEFKEMLLNS